MLSRTELEFLKSPKAFDSEYQRILRHRIRAKVQRLRQEVGLLGNQGFLGEFYAYSEENGMNQAYSWNRDLHSGGLGFKSPPVHKFSRSGTESSFGSDGQSLSCCCSECSTHIESD